MFNKVSSFINIIFFFYFMKNIKGTSNNLITRCWKKRRKTIVQLKLVSFYNLCKKVLRIIFKSKLWQILKFFMQTPNFSIIFDFVMKFYFRMQKERHFQLVMSRSFSKCFKANCYFGNLFQHYWKFIRQKELIFSALAYKKI